MYLETISPDKALDAAKYNQRVAYLGKIGQKRKDFCIDYIEKKKSIYRDALEKTTGELAIKNEKLTCVKGCVYCCYEFATADIRACEAIAYYVSQNDELLEKFIKSYMSWRERLAPHLALIDKICRTQDRVIHGDRTLAQALEQHIIEYFNLGIACPFLENNTCLIYEVRPDVCFSQASTTPPEWCSFKTDKVPNVVQLLDQPVITPFYYGRDPNFNTIEIMADTVFRLLTDSYRYLDKIPGMHGIYGEFIRDSEVRRRIDEIREEGHEDGKVAIS